MEEWQIVLLTGGISIVSSITTALITLSRTHRNEVKKLVLEKRSALYFEFYAFCKRFPDELTTEIFEHILNKALNNRMLDPSAVFIGGTHIKASANKKKFQKEQVAQHFLL